MTKSGNFIENIINEDIASGRVSGKIVTRFPPEPNGYLHIGHAKFICLNFDIANDHDGICYLRFDDTNPTQDDAVFEPTIEEDIKWLGYSPGTYVRHASDYYDRIYEYALVLIKTGKAYVCTLSEEKMREYRGTLTKPGINSPYRDRSIEENLALFERMKNGEFEERTATLRAKIDMASPNITMRDPHIYRVRKGGSHKLQDKWCIYPLYDLAQCVSDCIEGITHSLCKLELENRRPLYYWFLDALTINPPRPQQIEFSRLLMEYTVTAKDKLRELIDGSYVSGWDDPRMPTILGLRRRGYTASSIRAFCERIGISKNVTTVKLEILENMLREDLDRLSPRAMAVLNPVRVIIENYSKDEILELSVSNHPKDGSMGRRIVPFSKVVYIDEKDFCEEPPEKYFRLSPGKKVRLRHACVIECQSFVKDGDGKVTEIRCTYDPDTFDGKNPASGKVKGAIHWISEKNVHKAEVRLYNRLFTVPNPVAKESGKDFKEFLNPNSVNIVKEAYVESFLKDVEPETHFQFERVGFFCVDMKDSKKGCPVFNQAVTLRDGN